MSSFITLAQIVLIDLSLTGDNALVVGMAAATLPPQQRKRAMLIGIGAATVLRILMACFAAQILHITGLLVAGGILLLWVGWKMWREMYAPPPAEEERAKAAAQHFSSAVWQIIIADFSMSMDNILGVAGVARDHRGELVFGLVLSISLMGLASAQIAKIVSRYPKVVYVGIAIVLYVALHMIYDGTQQILHPATAIG